MIKAAGILFVSKKGNALFLKRAAGNARALTWEFPAGTMEEGETFEQTATREATEEIGFLPNGVRVLHTRTKGSAPGGAVGVGAALVNPVPAAAPAAPPPAPAPDLAEPVDFATFLQRVDEEFIPTLSHEHEGFAWAPVASPPEPLHPGCRIALERLSMDELGVARAIADGRLTSPQRYENVTLYAIRITGTDAAYRSKFGEFVFRRPENYLNDEFLARCGGLPVIFKHPVKALLNSEEFSNRVVGTVFLPYIAGDEVWAVVRVYVDAVSQMMEKGNLSTSPGVNFADFSVNAKLTMEDGSKVLVEGKPSLLDHIAICELGVWDKGGDPSGIRSESREDSAMTPEELKAKKDADDLAAKKDADEKAEEQAKKDAAKKDADEMAAKKDADAGTALDKKLSGIADAIGSMHKRMDAFEEEDKKRSDATRRRKDDDPEEAKRLAADAAKKDAEEQAKKDADEEAKKDADEKAKADAASKSDADIRRQIAELSAKIPKTVGDSDYFAMTDVQARADDVYSKFGQHAPRPMPGETPALYERRVVRDLKQHSPTWKAADAATAFADDAVFAVARDQVYKEATATALSPSTVSAGQLRMITKRQGGHEIHEFVGDPRSWMDPMAGATRQYVTSIVTPKL